MDSHECIRVVRVYTSDIAHPTGKEAQRGSRVGRVAGAATVGFDGYLSITCSMPTYYESISRMTLCGAGIPYYLLPSI